MQASWANANAPYMECMPETEGGQRPGEMEIHACEELLSCGPGPGDACRFVNSFDSCEGKPWERCTESPGRIRRYGFLDRRPRDHASPAPRRLHMA